jgi:hypothetical protein
MDAETPKSVAAGGGILHRNDGREVPDTLDALFDYDRFCVNMAGTFNSASTAGQGIQFLGTEGSLSVLLGGGMVEQPEYKRENYEYSIDSWPKAMQEAFLNQDNHRSESQGTGSKPAPENLEFADKPDATVLHLANFIDAVRTRQPSYETAEVGHHAAAAGHMVNLSYRSGKRMLWDANKGNAAEL